MTVAELIRRLERANPYLVVQVWDSEQHRFTEKFYLQAATFDDELLITPSPPGATADAAMPELFADARSSP